MKMKFERVLSGLLAMGLVMCLLPAPTMADATPIMPPPPSEILKDDDTFIFPEDLPRPPDIIETEPEAPDLPGEDETETPSEDETTEPDEPTQDPEPSPEPQIPEPPEWIGNEEVPAEELPPLDHEIVDPTMLQFPAVQNFRVPADFTCRYVTQPGQAIQAQVFTREGALPEGVTLQSELLEAGSAASDRALAGLREEFADGRVFTLSFLKDGVEAEPKGGAYVYIESNGIVPESVDPETIQIHHLPTPAPKPMLMMQSMEAQPEGVVSENTVARINLQQGDLEAGFYVSSFSFFTVTWNDGNAVKATLELHYVDSSGNELDLIPTENLQIKQSQVLDLTQFALNHFTGDQSKKYKFDHAYFKKKKNEINVNRIFYDSTKNSLMYYDENGAAAKVLKQKNKNYVIYMVYTPIENSKDKVIMDVVNNIQESISINLYNYGTNQGNAHAEDNPVNQGHILHFSGGAGVGDGDKGTRNPNHWTGNFGNGVYQGIVEPQLDSGGFPVATHDGRRESLSYLFSPGDPDVTAYEGTNGLLQKGADGYYYFDSHQNFASLDTATHSFTLYTDNPGIASGAREPAYFMPFSSYAPTQQNNSAAEYHFGMSIGFDFMLSQTGTINGEPLIFEFSGDDDFWVFIDDKLVLDMGGIHNNYNGQINFADRTVQLLNDPNITQPVSLDSLMGAGWDSKQAHSFKAFYMERGAHASNCKLRFNMIPIPQNQLIIGKSFGPGANSTQEEVDKIAANYRYKFQTLMVDGNGQLLQPEKPFIKPGMEYEILYKGVATGEKKLVDENGFFSLAVNESAKFDTSLLSGQYIVREMIENDRYTGQFDGMSFVIEHLGGKSEETEGTNAPVKDGFTGFDSTPHNSENSSQIVFTNKVNTDATSHINIKKVVVAGDEALTNQSFDFRVSIDDKPVRIGVPYSLIAPDGTITNKKVATAGQISLRNGETASFTILKGSPYLVEEITTGDFETSYRVEVNQTPVTTGVPVTGVIQNIKTEVNVIVTNKGHNDGPIYADELPQAGGFGWSGPRLFGLLICAGGCLALQIRRRRMA